ncbi:MAG TPA: glycine/betaine ABC transporter substrate-binding protein [Candidatus Blautia faecavium]|uniref:Glycine/betaine ABC transporter substrate-binding protein n=1 Tax=Candidatus Blautia faecavium TaxID=2838487 RepID=A0A9D2LRQ5_9FIRM|nr:glycine/betaine ABC transporter substrate-binding protein [Candidatus Blautia faecavium]
MKKRLFTLLLAGALLTVNGGYGSIQEVKAASDPIQIATKPMTEQYILGEMLRLIIEDKTDYEAEITKGIGGGTSNIQPAMEKGEFDLYPEYTSSGWVMVLGHEADEVDDEEMFEKLKEEYEENYDMTWVGLYGFNNTFAVAVRSDVAEEYGLETTSDLAEVSDQLVFGGNPDYVEREDGFGLLEETYGLNFKDVKDIDIGLKYQAMESGDIDVTNGFTTDAQLSRDDVKVLEDDKHLQVNYFCSTVVRNEALEEYPGLEDALMEMDGILTDQEMAELNYQVEVDGKDEADVAEKFLISKGILEE